MNSTPTRRGSAGFAEQVACRYGPAVPGLAARAVLPLLPMPEDLVQEAYVPRAEGA